jgi:hypothetical protein
LDMPIRDTSVLIISTTVVYYDRMERSKSTREEGDAQMASGQFEAPSSLSAEESWTNAFEEVCQRIGPCFAQGKTWQRAQAYLRGLLSPVERKNSWQLAEEAGETPVLAT